MLFPSWSRSTALFFLENNPIRLIHNEQITGHNLLYDKLIQHTLLSNK